MQNILNGHGRCHHGSKVRIKCPQMSQPYSLLFHTGESTSFDTTSAKVHMNDFKNLFLCFFKTIAFGNLIDRFTVIHSVNPPSLKPSDCLNTKR